jgi:DNA helicase-2/ATP-dependent DNA helicase PcrA
MTIVGKELELADEQSAQKRYSRELQDRYHQPRYVEGLRNGIWVDGIAPPSGMPDGHLIGRVALTSPDPDLAGSDFYIGETRASVDGIRVFSWAAPVACTFFRGTRHHEWCDKVAAIRAFVVNNGQITDFEEEIVRDDAPAPFFRKRGLTVPAAPVRPRSLPRSNPAGRSADMRFPVSPPSTSLGHGSKPSPVPSKPATVPSVRAEELLRRQLQAPRMKSLAPVLATLQPDQYSLVTEPTMTCMIIEGQPGTGKTIVASHRAAYLINDETPRQDTLDGRILFVGPTDGYTRHVGNVVGRLTGGSDRIMVRAIPQLIKDVLGLRNEPGGSPSHGWRDAAADLGELATKAVYQLKSVNGPALNAEKAYEYLRSNGEPRRPITTDPEWIPYLRQLPPYRKALALRVHAPLLAVIRFEWDGPTALGLDRIEHIIVDEAQDVTPLEWYLLKEINQTIGWTLLGDLNQRRSDHTLASWAQIREVLQLEDDEATVRRLQRGYRSTKPILQYANHLLPSSERAVLAFQSDGPAPIVRRVPAQGLMSAIIEETDRLLAAYPAGTLAVISPKPATVWAGLRSAGWTTVTGHDSRAWERNGRSVTVLHPDDARGLEYDAVIVVEPAEFPCNYGRQGPLYTALTRPNRELAIVHARPLPDALRRK